MSDHTKSPAAGQRWPAGNDHSLSAVSLHPTEWALFLDIDGTLIDLAETPDAVVVPTGLPAALHRLSLMLGGSLALVTGRSVAVADRLFAPHRFPVAGLHGAERRDAEGLFHEVSLTEAFDVMKRSIKSEASAWRGVIIEDKGAAIAAHYRLAPDLEEAVLSLMQRSLRAAGADWTLQRGKMVVEIRPSRADKGAAVEAFLGEVPFKGRRPLAIGDDVTDEAMFLAVNRLGGQSLRIGEPNATTHARSHIASPARLRDIIAALAPERNEA